MSAALTFYREAVLCAQQQAWDQATVHLTSAFDVAPPSQLSAEDCQALACYSDDLAYIGQGLPCLTPTLQLFARFVALQPASS